MKAGSLPRAVLLALFGLPGVAAAGEGMWTFDGFLAPSRDQEAACPGYEVNVLVRRSSGTRS